MPSLKLNGITRHHGDVYGVVEGGEQRFYVVAYSGRDGAWTMERVAPEIIEALSPIKYEAALGDLFPLREVG